MDFNLKQWRLLQQQQQDESELQSCAKFPKRLHFDSQQQQQQQQIAAADEQEELDQLQQEAKTTASESSPALPLFVPTTKLTSSNLSVAFPSPHHSITTSFPKGMGVPESGSYLSYVQWQELELQALIYRHMLAGAAVPPQLLQLVKKSLYTNTTPTYPNSLSSSSSPYYHPLQHYSHYHPALLQSGYWGRGAMDPEPGRCRRTDGKKWRCSRDVVAGQKYCERHVHRGRNRSRKPVELPTTSSTLGGSASAIGGGGGGGGGSTTNNAFASQTGMAVRTHFDLSGPSSSVDYLHHAQRPSEPKIESKFPSEMKNEGNGNVKSGTGQVLRHFFDDWPRRPLEGSENSGSNALASSTSLSISAPTTFSSDFSLKLSTGGNRPEDDRGGNNVERERIQLNWGGAGWGTNQVGGPLAEALRSSLGSNSSPTSVLNLVK